MSVFNPATFSLPKTSIDVFTSDRSSDGLAPHQARKTWRTKLFSKGGRTWTVLGRKEGPTLGAFSLTVMDDGRIHGCFYPEATPRQVYKHLKGDVKIKRLHYFESWETGFDLFQDCMEEMSRTK